MNETHGLILKITDQMMVVMCDDGKYRNLPLPDKIPSVGERIAVPLSRRKKRIPRSWFAAAAACLLMLISAAVWWPGQQPEYDYFMAIDINPSLELYLNANGYVAKVGALNPEAENIANQVTLEKLPVQDAIEKVIAASIAFGYIEQTKDNMIMISAANLQGASEMNLASIESVVAKTLQTERIDGFIKIEQIDKAIITDAKAHHLSVNQWLVIQHADRIGISINRKKAASESITEILKDAGIRKEQWFMPVPSAAAPAPDEPKSSDSSVERKNAATETYRQTSNAATAPPAYAGSASSSLDSTKSDGQRQQTFVAPARSVKLEAITETEGLDAPEERGALEEPDVLDEHVSFEESDELEEHDSFKESDEIEDRDSFEGSDELDDRDSFEESEAAEEHDSFEGSDELDDRDSFEESEAPEEHDSFEESDELDDRDSYEEPEAPEEHDSFEDEGPEASDEYDSFEDEETNSSDDRGIR